MNYFVAKYLPEILLSVMAAMFIGVVWWCIDRTGYNRGLTEGRRIEVADLAAQKEKLQQECNNEKLATKQANDELQQSNHDISAKLAALKRLHPATCIKPIVAQHTAGGQQHAGQNGIGTDWLREFGAECETYRSEVIVLDNFGKKYCKQQ